MSATSTTAADRPAGCGSCTMCCKLLGIEELAKPAGAWCPNCDTGRGCRIYEGRPRSCRDFACVWLVGVEDGRGADPDLRPDRCKVVFHEPVGRGESVLAHVDPGFPDAWKQGPAFHRIAAWAGSGVTVAVKAGRRHFLVDREGVHEASVVATSLQAGLALSRGRRLGRIR